AWKIVRGELDQYGAGLTGKPEVIGLTKSDLLDEKQRTKVLKALRKAAGDVPIFAVSAPIEEGLEPLLDAIIQRLGSEAQERFERGNVTGTLAMLAAATAGGVRRFVHVSSLAVREPNLSLYGASKARSEELVESSGLDWAIVRPPAVYGPGDKETLELFKMAKRGQIYLPPAGKLSLIHVDDLAELLLALTRRGAPKKILIEPDDRRPGGWTHREFGAALAR